MGREHVNRWSLIAGNISLGFKSVVAIDRELLYKGGLTVNSLAITVHMQRRARLYSMSKVPGKPL